MRKKNFGGKWTRQKLDVFLDYVKAYLIILNRFKKEYGWQTIYFDGFAGYGKREIEQENAEEFLFVLEPLPEYRVYEGASVRVLQLPEPFIFDWYYFIDKDPGNTRELEKLKKEITHISPKQIVIREGDANQQIKQLAETLVKKRKYAALAFLDPFGMQINWESIASLGQKSPSGYKPKCDLWILLPSGVAINRLLDKKRNFKVKYKEKLERFFGLPITEIEALFFKPGPKQLDLFGNDQGNTMQKIPNPIEQIAGLYVRQLKTVFDYVTEQPLVLKNSKNVPIFHFIFASNNRTAYKIASQIIDNNG